MIIKREISIVDFKAWSGACSTLKAIINADKVEEFDYLIEEIFPDGLSETELHDLLWFDSDWVFEALGMSDEEDEEE